MQKNKSFQLRVALILSLIITISFSCNNSEETVSGLSLDTLTLADAKMQALVDGGKLPCISTMILKDGKVVHRRTIGLANIEENRVLEEDAIFRIYSMSKPITAAALMILYDEGKFQLDDPVAGYIPEFEETKVWVDGEEVDQQEPFTIKHLLTHTAGFCYGWDVSHVDSLYAQATPEGIWGLGTLEEVVKLLATIPLRISPVRNMNIPYPLMWLVTWWRSCRECLLINSCKHACLIRSKWWIPDSTYQKRIRAGWQ
jgi:CubicO group peptidase (beta-lactamase class C family)